MYLRDLQGNEYPVMTTYTISDEIEGNIVLSADIVSNKVNKLFIDDLSEFWELVIDETDDTNEEIIYKISYCKVKANGMTPTKTIKAIPKAFDDLNRSRVYPRYEGPFAIDELLRIIFTGTDYSYRLLGTWNNIKVEGFGEGDTRLNMLKYVMNRIGAEFYFNKESFTITDKIGTETQAMYRRRLNASNIVHEVDAQEYYTFARGYGDYREDDKGWENAKLIRDYESPLMKLLGKREAPPIKNANINNPDTMDEQLKYLVDNSIKISVTADLVDLRNQNYPYAQSNLGDTGFLIDEVIGLDEEIRIVKRQITRNWKNKIIDLNYTFGSEGLVTRYTNKTSNAINTMIDIWEGRKKLPFTAMSHEIQILTGLMLNVQTQFAVAENGSLLAINKENPNLVVIYNANGLFVSEDGGQTPKAAITGRGIMGDAIIAKSITADKLDANAIVVGFNNSSTNLKLFKDRLEFYDSNNLVAYLRIVNSRPGSYSTKSFAMVAEKNRSLDIGYMDVNDSYKSMFSLDAKNKTLKIGRNADFKDTDVEVFIDNISWLKGTEKQGMQLDYVDSIRAQDGTLSLYGVDLISNGVAGRFLRLEGPLKFFSPFSGSGMTFDSRTYTDGSGKYTEFTLYVTGQSTGIAINERGYVYAVSNGSKTKLAGSDWG